MGITEQDPSAVFHTPPPNRTPGGCALSGRRLAEGGEGCDKEAECCSSAAAYTV